MHQQPLFHDLRHRQARAEGTERVLEDDLHVRAARPQLRPAFILDVLTHEDDGSVAFDQPQQAKPQRGLAGPGFANNADRVPAPHRQRDTIHCLHVVHGAFQHPLLDREPHLEIVGLHDLRRIRPGCQRLALGFAAQEVAGVVMLRVREQALRLAGLDDMAMLHDANPVGHLADDTEVMGDEQHGHAHLLLQPLEQLQDLRLHGHVQGRGRFIGDEQARLVGERHGDHHALALAAGQFVRVGAQALLGVLEADLVEQFQHPLTGGFGAEAPMDSQHFAHLPLDGVQRIERCHRLLEDHRDLVAANAHQRAFIRAHDILAAIADGARRMRCCRIGQELHQRQGGDGFA